MFKLKKDEKGRVVCHKARLVVLGNQECGIDHHKVFAPMVKQKTLRILLSLSYSCLIIAGREKL